ncbi:MAG: TIGR00730 family Rossman fold protein, partial [Fulvivirga sp.]|nr:TIGR00730 family Rossman fold protein [Fulvivirga sp.]
MKNVCVFCGSSPGKNKIYTDAAEALGKLIATHDMRLIYGGGRVGLMGKIADAVIAHGGHVTGVIPDFLQRKEVGHPALTKLIVVESMHERKQKMAELADAFIALPGGFGTLEELAEIVTWVQLSLVNK